MVKVRIAEQIAQVSVQTTIFIGVGCGEYLFDLGFGNQSPLIVQTVSCRLKIVVGRILKGDGVVAHKHILVIGAYGMTIHGSKPQVLVALACIGIVYGFLHIVGISGCTGISLHALESPLASVSVTTYKAGRLCVKDNIAG